MATTQIRCKKPIRPKAQYIAPPLDAAELTRVQEILGTLLYYDCAIDFTMILVTIGTLASQQANGTKATVDAIIHLLNYCATHSDATVRYFASDMALHIENDASFLSETKVCSRPRPWLPFPQQPTQGPNQTTPTRRSTTHA
jgi:hypothetical protein